MNVDFRTDGFVELSQILDALPDSLNRKIIKSALNKAANPIANAARQNLKSILSKSTNKRREKGRAPGNLIFSIKGARAKATRKYAQGVSIVLVGPKWDEGRHGHLIEFGTYKQAPRPFLRPAWDSQKKNAERVMKEQIEKLLHKEAKKAKVSR